MYRDNLEAENQLLKAEVKQLKERLEPNAGSIPSELSDEELWSRYCMACMSSPKDPYESKSIYQRADYVLLEHRKRFPKKEVT